MIIDSYYEVMEKAAMFFGPKGAAVVYIAVHIGIASMIYIQSLSMEGKSHLWEHIIQAVKL